MWRGGRWGLPLGLLSLPCPALSSGGVPRTDSCRARPRPLPSASLTGLLTFSFRHFLPYAFTSDDEVAGYTYDYVSVLVEK